MSTEFSAEAKKIIDLCQEYPPNFAAIEEQMKSGVSLNEFTEDETILTEILQYYPYVNELRFAYCEQCTDDDCEGCSLNITDADGRYLPQIVQMFLENGYDCNADNGKLGLKALQSLVWSSKDVYMLQCAKLFMQAGVDPQGIPYDDDYESIIAYTHGKASAGFLIDESYYLEELYYTLYSIMDAYVKLQNYMDVDFCTQAIGHTLRKAEIHKSEYDCGQLQSGMIENNLIVLRDNLVLWCDDLPLYINHTADILINPNIPEETADNEITSYLYKEIAGLSIESIMFYEMEKMKILDYSQGIPVVFINLSNEQTMVLFLRHNLDGEDTWTTGIQLRNSIDNLVKML